MSNQVGNVVVESDKAVLQAGGKTLEMPIVRGSEGERAIDIAELRKVTGAITLDEGYANTGSTTSAITYLDGDLGVLRYRGYPIEELAEHCDFVETSYLLIYGELPTWHQLENFRHQIRRHTMLHEDMRSFYNGFPRDAHPMAILSSVVAALSTFYQDSLDVHDPEEVKISIHRLLAKLPTIAAYSYKKSTGQPFIYPQNSLDYCENFLRMMFAVPSEEYEPDHRRFAWWDHRTPIYLHRFQRGFVPSGARCMAGPMKPASTCSIRSPRMAATSKSTSTWRRTRRAISA
jgi:citrate synthase